MNQPLLATMHMAHSNENLREAFENDGFVVIETNIPESVLDQASEDVRPILDRASRVQDAWQKSKAVRRIATWPSLLTTLRELYGRPPKPFQTLNFQMGTEQEIHSDTVHFNSMPQGLMCGVWVALEDISDAQGPLIYYPGSHKWPEYTLRDVEEAGYFKRGLFDELLTFGNRLGVPPHQQGPHYKEYERFIADKVRASGIKPGYGTIKKGQAIVWASNLHHGGSPQRDKSLTRKSQVSHYFFEGGRYYTPLHSHGSYVYFRKPKWIPALED